MSWWPPPASDSFVRADACTTTVAGVIPVADNPRWSLAAALDAARSAFGLDGTATALPSERDQNVLLTTADGSSVVLKIANAHESQQMLEAEVGAMEACRATGLTPNVLSSTAGGPIVEIDGHLVRCVTVVPGVTMARLRHRSDELLRSLGRAVGSVNAALDGVEHPALHRDFVWDLARAPEVIAEGLHQVADIGLASAVSEASERARAALDVHGPSLRTAVIHNDANDHNVLVDPAADSVSGIVDFGDMVVSHLVNDLAIAGAYGVLDAADPLAAMASITAGFHATRPLQPAEVAVLWPLVGLRLAASVVIAARQQAERPGDDYLGVSQGPIARTLPRLLAVHPRLAHYRLRAACGWEPVPEAPRVRAWLSGRRHAAVVAPELTADGVVHLDLSIPSPLVAGDGSQNTTEPLAARIEAMMVDAGARVAMGGYLEARNLYASPAFAADASGERRTIHLGVDVAAPAGTGLHVPIDAVVHGFEFADKPGDYGPVIVLRHDVADADGPLRFHTLWGHLSVDSLDGVQVGDPLGAGTEFARIGAPPSNGGWFPHLHLQVVIDLLDVPVNIDGACRPSQQAVWASLCPDPALVLGVPSMPAAANPTGMRAHRRVRTPGNLSVSYGDHPLAMARGYGQYLFDTEGRQYLDGYNNVAHVGHGHPAVVRAVAQQWAVLNTNTRYLQHQLLDYADALVARLPEPLSVCCFTASGSEANELALRLARAHTGAKDLVVMDSAYHGHTTTLIDISPYKHDGPGGSGRPDWVHLSPIPDTYRGEFRAADEAAGVAYGRQVGAVVESVLDRGRRLCGYIAESAPSVAGQLLLPDGFLPEVYRAVRAAGGVCIADEVQTGFGRLGSEYWAFEASGVVPDIVVLGKPIANGYPMGAVVTTAEIAASFDNGMEFFSTFGGSTAACAAAMATMQVVDDEGLMANAGRVGSQMLASLADLAQRHELIGDVRGAGLFIGVELVRDRTTLEPADREATRVVNRMRDLGVLVGTDGPFHNVVKVRGPMVITSADADRLVDTFDRALAELQLLP